MVKGVQRCSACRDGIQAPFPFSMAFQPIVDTHSGNTFAYEALVRGLTGEGAATILGQVNDGNRYSFDQHCRVRAITLAARLGLVEGGSHLSINFMPGAVYSPAACIQLTLRTAEQLGFPCDHLIFEMTENEMIVDRGHLRAIATEYRRHGFKIAIDDFGAGHSGLNLLADFPADIIKLDMELTRNLHQRPRAIAIMKHMVSLATSLGSRVVAEGIETLDEFRAVEDCGISLMQGYLLARPGFEMLPEVSLPRYQETAVADTRFQAA